MGWGRGLSLLGALRQGAEHGGDHILLPSGKAFDLRFSPPLQVPFPCYQGGISGRAELFSSEASLTQGTLGSCVQSNPRWGLARGSVPKRAQEAAKSWCPRGVRGPAAGLGA